jgi:hypothetical protein
MQDALFAIESLADKDLSTKYAGWTLRQYLESKGVAEPYLDMACAGYANTVAGTLDLLTVAGAVRQERLWNNDGAGDMALHPSTQLVRWDLPFWRVAIACSPRLLSLCFCVVDCRHAESWCARSNGLCGVQRHCACC